MMNTAKSFAMPTSRRSEQPKFRQGTCYETSAPKIPAFDGRCCRSTRGVAHREGADPSVTAGATSGRISAGGEADAASRIIAARLSEIWGQPVIVENKSGSGGNTANDAAAHAAPDGYTILLATGAPAIHGFLLGSVTYDPVNDLSPVSMVGSYPGILAVSNSSPLRSVSDYVAFAKANLGKVIYSSPGVGTTGRLSGELFKRKAGIELTTRPIAWAAST